MSDAAAADSDTTTVLEILRGAAVGPRDPDVALAELLARLVNATEGDAEEGLAELVRDAHRD